MKQTLTKDDVKKVAVEQIETNGRTTSLDVKNELRKNDFWATQADISVFLQQLVTEGVLESSIAPDWEDFSPIPFNQYYAPTFNYTPAVINNVLFQAQAPQIKTVPDSGDWMLYDYSQQCQDQMYISGNTDRNVARAIYEKTFNVAYANVACNRIP